MSHNTPPRPSDPYGDPYGQPPPRQQVPPHQPTAGPDPYGAPVPHGAPPPAPQPPADQGDTGGGFFKALFDFSFTNYATPSIVRIIYVVAIVFGTLGWLAGAVSALGSGRGLLLVAVVLVLGWIPLLLWISILRVGLEMVLASVRTAENTRKLREHQGL